MFYSDNFTFNNIYSKDFNICLVSQGTGVLNDYGIKFDINNSKDTTITLGFCYANEKGIPLEWDQEVLKNFLEWMITDDYCEFISEDNEEVVYFLKGVEYTKKFTNEFKGIVEITFNSISPFGYRHSLDEISSNVKHFGIYNYSNYDDSYKPVITLKNISSDEITITNQTTGKAPFDIYNLNGNTEIIVDGKMGTIINSEGKNLINNSNRNWIELKKGENIFTVEGNCSITMESYYPVMV